MGKSKRDDRDEENADKEVNRISKKKKLSVDAEVEETNFKSTKDAKKKKKKRQSEDSGAEETNLNSTKDAMKKRQSEDSGAEETNLNSSIHVKKKRKKKRKSKDSEAEETNLNSAKDAKKKRKKKKRQSEDPGDEETNLKSSKNAKKKRKKKKKKRQIEDSEAVETNINSTKDAEKKRKKKRQSEDSEAEETSMNSTKGSPKEREKKQECGKNDKDVTTPSSKSTKKVVFSDHVEFFPANDEESQEEEATLVRGKRFTKEEDKLIKNAVLEYVDNHALGDDGVKMIMECKLHPQLKGCWKDIGTALPWRTYLSVYHRAHVLFEAGSQGTWTKEDMEFVLEYQKKHGNDWKTLADAMGKSRKHVKDAWRRYRLRAKKNGHWMREEYQALFDLVNKDIKSKAFQEKHSKHGMLRDNIPWMAVSDQLESRDHTECCIKWYDQLTSPLVAKGIWANVDDYRLLEELSKLDAACIDDVDWDNLLDNRDGETCRKRWNQMVKHIGSPGSKTFAEQVEVLSERYCPDLAEDREDFDNRPYDPED